MEVRVLSCTKEYFDEVKKHIDIMCLDNRGLNYSEFLTALLPDNQLVGFGRLRIYSECAEICSVGVIENYRKKGIGKKIIFSLIDKFYQKYYFNRKNLYVVTIIPQYFQKFGFEITDKFPAEIENKLHYCTKSLAVPEKYEVMKLVADDPIYNR